MGGVSLRSREVSLGCTGIASRIRHIWGDWWVERGGGKIAIYIAPAEIDETDEAALQKLGHGSGGGAQTLISISRHREIAGDRARSRSAFRGPEA